MDEAEDEADFRRPETWIRLPAQPVFAYPTLNGELHGTKLHGDCKEKKCEEKVLVLIVLAFIWVELSSQFKLCK
jgi:hypothetical protein